MSIINSIPASEIVQVNPSVLSASGSALELISLFLSSSTRVPIGTVPSFPDAASVSKYFGAASDEAKAAALYFAGYVGAEQLPEALLFAQYNASAVSAYLRGGSLATMTLAQLQALTGSLTVVMDGYSRAITGQSLSAATSFSSAAAILQTAFAGTEPTEASVTAAIGATATGTGSGNTLTLSAVVGLVSVGDSVSGTGVPANTVITGLGTGTGGNGTYTTNNVTTASSTAITVSSNFMNVTVIGSGIVAVGQIIQGTSITVNTQIIAGGAGTGGVGTYKLTGNPQQVVSETVTCLAPNIAVTYDSVSSAFVVTSELTGVISTAAFATGTLSTSLALTSATGAVLSQGADAATPSTFMTGITQLTQNWVAFMTVFDPDNGSGNAQKLLFAQWNSLQNDQYAYVAWDTDVNPQNQNPATTSLGYLVNNTDSYAGTVPISSPDYSIAAGLCGSIASIDTSLTEGRITFAFRQFPGAVPSVVNSVVANNLTANGYSFYGAYASRANNFNFFQNGFVSGSFKWLDSYINQIWFNSNLQGAVLNGLLNVGSVPYNSAGYSLIEAWCQGPINAALNFGAIRTGVTLSATQITQVNQAAGQNVASLLQTRGYYLQVSDASPTTRAARQSPPCKLWYCDGGAVQQITLDSIELQ
jgi:hypothetical protein